MGNMWCSTSGWLARQIKKKADPKGPWRTIAKLSDELFEAPTLDKYLEFRCIQAGDITAEQLLTLDHVLAARDELERLTIKLPMVLDVLDGDDKSRDRRRSERPASPQLRRQSRSPRPAPIA